MLLVALQGILILLTAIASPTTEAATTAAPVFNAGTTAAPMGSNETTAAPVTPGVNVTAAPTTPEVNVTTAAPVTPGVNVTAAPMNPEVDVTTAPTTLKYDGNITTAPTTPDVNATTKPKTPKVNGTATPMTLATTEITTPETKKPNSTTEIPESTTPKTKKPKSTTEIPQSTTSKPPKKDKKTSRLTNIDTEIKIDKLPEEEINEILNKTSPGRKNFEKKFKQTIRKVFKDKNQDIADIIINSIRRGSIIVEYTIVLNGSSPEEVKQAVKTIQEQIKSGKVGNFTVNKDHSTNTKITVSADQFNACEPVKTEPDQKDQKLLILLSVSVGVLGLLVVLFVILFCVLCKQRKAFKENL